MATYLPAAQLNAAIAALFPAATATFLDWNTVTPGTTGGTPIAGFTRQSSAWTAAATGKEHNSAAMTFTSAPTCTIKFFSEWSAVTAGTYKGGGPTTATVSVASGSTVSVAIGGITVKVTG